MKNEYAHHDQLANYLFVVKHVTKEPGSKLIYGIGLNGTTYFFIKTLHIEDCKQLDSRPPLGLLLFTELCAIITEIELAYLERPSTEIINQQIGTILKRIRIGRV